MKILCLTYTCPKDAHKAAATAALLPPHWRQIWCVESAHEAEMRELAPCGVELMVRDFPRGATLRNAGAIRGMRSVFLELATEADIIVKKDSDAALFRPQAFTGPIEYGLADFAYIRRSLAESRMLANGCCYVVSRRAALRLSKFDPDLNDAVRQNFAGHEDLVFSHFWTCVERELYFAQINKHKVHWFIRPYWGADIIAAHYGYITDRAFDTAFSRHKAIIAEAQRRREIISAALCEAAQPQTA